MPIDLFAEQLAKVRQRYASTLQGKIDDTYAALPRLVGEETAVVDAVGEAYRRIHGISGVGPTVGFVATGQAARATEAVLLAPYKGRRGLTTEEITRLETTLGALRETAQRELAAMSGSR
ncbi:MAG: hypothetical protein WA418_38000 [Bradyrhizobium sp.]